MGETSLIPPIFKVFGEINISLQFQASYGKPLLLCNVDIYRYGESFVCVSFQLSHLSKHSETEHLNLEPYWKCRVNGEIVTLEGDGQRANERMDKGKRTIVIVIVRVRERERNSYRTVAHSISHSFSSTHVLVYISYTKID